jgi:DNA-binding transcriptional LysR family regulator
LLIATSITLRQLEYFVTTARTGSMAKAAATLHVSAAAVSLGLSQLERSLGCDLFLRRPQRPLALTGAGRELLPKAASLISDAEQIEQDAGQRSGGFSGSIRVGCFDTLAPMLVPRLLSALRERYPSLEVDVSEGQSQVLQEQLLDAGTDLAVLYGLEVLPGLRTELLWTMAPYIVLPGDHRLAQRESVRLADLIDEPMIVLDAPPSRMHVMTTLASVGLTPTVARVTHNFETLRSLVGRGYGWGLLVQRPVVDRSYEGFPVASVAIADPIDPAPVVAATVARSTLPRRTDAVIALLREFDPSRTAD